MTAAIAAASDDQDVAELVEERRQMRRELEARSRAEAGNVVAIGAAKRRRDV